MENNENITKCTHHNRSKETKINNFTHDNQFIIFKNNPAHHHQKTIKQILKQCNNIISKENRWKYMNMNHLHATLKPHEQNTPIRPIINWKNMLSYELAKQKYYI